MAPKRQCGQKNRSVSTDFFNHDLYPCIRYSVTKDAVYCIVCILFGNQKIVLTTEPLTDWSNARRLISKHEKTSDHKFAQQRSIDFLRVFDKEQLGIVQHMTKAQYELLQHNTKVLHAIISLIATCGKQNVPIRGKTDDRSNFMAFLKYRAEADPDLKQHLDSCPKNAKYTSHRIQNELINLCGNQIRSKIIGSIKTARVFTVWLMKLPMSVAQSRWQFAFVILLTRIRNIVFKRTLSHLFLYEILRVKRCLTLFSHKLPNLDLILLILLGKVMTVLGT